MNKFAFNNNIVAMLVQQHESMQIELEQQTQALESQINRGYKEIEDQTKSQQPCLQCGPLGWTTEGANKLM